MDLPLIGPQGRGYSLPLNAQRTVNLYPVIDPAGKRSPALYGTPGCETWATLGPGPIRGLLEFDGLCFVVTGDKLYSIAAGRDPTTTLRGTLNTVEGPVTLETNGLQVIVADGDCSVAYLDNYGILKPSTTGNFYVLDLSTWAFAPMFPPDVPSGQSFYVTSLADFTTVDALAFASAESSPDDLLRVFADGELFLFGAQSSEVWRDDAGDFPFVRVESIRRGLAAQHGVCRFDNTLAFVGDDRKLYRLNGYTAVRMSDGAVEESLAAMDDVSDCIAFSYDQGVGKFAVFVFPSADVTWVFDAASNLWHERSSNGGAWRARCYMKRGSVHLIGDAATNKLLEIRTNLYDEDGDDLIAQHVMPCIWSDLNPISHDRLQLDVEAGVGLGDGSEPHIGLDWSDDGGRSWSNRLWRSLGKLGEYFTQVTWFGLGFAKTRFYRITISAPVKRVIIGASGNGSVGQK